MLELDLVLRKLLPNGGSEDLVEAVLDRDEQRICEVLTAIKDLEKRARMTQIVKHLSAFLEMEH